MAESWMAVPWGFFRLIITRELPAERGSAVPLRVAVAAVNLIPLGNVPGARPWTWTQVSGRIPVC
jgi:hypothetical protein